MDGVLSRRRQALGLAVMTTIALLQIGVEYLATNDANRMRAKLTVLAIGLPFVVVWASAIFRWATRWRAGAIVLLFTGAIVSGVVFAGLTTVVRIVGLSITGLRPNTPTWSEFDVIRIGFAAGLTNFSLWALAFVFPFAAEDARLRALESEKLRSQAELAQLRAHLEPHFLLNTLNAIAGLVTEDPRLARQLLATLGDLLRDALRADGEMQTLEAQLEWLRRYAEILEVRHAGHLTFLWRVQSETRGALLPRLLLQPLVENAVKHGALMRQDGGEITVTTRLDGERLVCTVEDNGPGMPGGAERPGAFGLPSVRRRLTLRYADAANLRLESSASGTRSVVELPYHE